MPWTSSYGYNYYDIKNSDYDNVWKTLLEMIEYENESGDNIALSAGF